jgi:hypothetical protein
MKRQRPGYYVEGRYYGFNIAQAQARAEFLTKEYGREVLASYIGSDGKSAPVAPAKAAVVPITRGK